MNYYIDTEFLEGTQAKSFLGFKYGETKPTIDLISIGIVSEDGREYYAVSKDFNLREAWDRWEQRTGEGDRNNIEFRRYWIRENVLKPIFDQWENEINGKIVRLGLPISLSNMKFNYRNFKHCIKCIGKTNKQIAEEIKQFTQYEFYKVNNEIQSDDVVSAAIENKRYNPSFYGYYSDYDWVAFCWLFGKMNDLPKGFPMYCIDLKQMLDEKVSILTNEQLDNMCSAGLMNHPEEIFTSPLSLGYKLGHIERWHMGYPKQTNEHHALSDARWNKELHEFLKSL